MTAVLLTPLTGQFFDNNGDPLNGGLIYSYISGTLTPQATYTDATGTVPAANPIVLDSSGRANVWGSGTYKFIIKDSLGNTISTLDSVTAIFGSGDMTKAVYDTSNISEQLVGLTAVQTLTNKTLTAPVLNGNLGALTATSINFGGSTLSNYTASGSWTPSPTGLTVTGTPTYIGTYTRIGNMVFCSLNISATTSTASTTGTTYFTGLPVTPSLNSSTVGAANVGTGAAISGTGIVFSGTQRAYMPTWGATQAIQVNFWYLA